jgi:predicted nucleic acid-binding protein
LLLTALVAVGLSLWKIHLAPYYRQKWAIDELKRLGVEIRTQPADDPAWVGWLLGEEYFREVTYIATNRGDHVSGERLRRLVAAIERLPFIEELRVVGDLTDADLACLKHAHLRSLQIPRCRITDAGLAHVAHMDGLEALVLSDTRITDAGLKHLEGLRQLEILVLCSTQVSGEGLRYLREAHSNLFLQLQGAPLTDDGLAHAKHLPRGTIVWVRSDRISRQALRQVRKAHPDLRIDIIPPAKPG